jgi:ATP-dependent Clp protease ATP-binding subunit ClpA
MTNNSRRPDVRSIDPRTDVAKALSKKLVGQPAAIDAIVPFVEMHRAMLSPEDRPAGIFLLLGPTGSGKTKTVEALAEVLHGSPKKVLRIDCGEFQMEHEVAKLIGAPPGYLGHRETQPLLTQQKVNAASSESCDLSILLFDEIEKGAPSMTRLLLGILDKGVLRLGDCSSVNFEKTLIFMTSNLGAAKMSQELRPGFGFGNYTHRLAGARLPKLQNIGLAAVRKNFLPEFVNRLDKVITYQPLNVEALALILGQHIGDLQAHLNRRLGQRTFQLEVPPRTRRFLLEKGTSDEYGARELKRTIQRLLIQPLASMIAAGQIDAGACVRADVNQRKDKLIIRNLDRDKIAC